MSNDAVLVKSSLTKLITFVLPVALCPSLKLCEPVANALVVALTLALKPTYKLGEYKLALNDVALPAVLNVL